MRNRYKKLTRTYREVVFAVPINILTVHVSCTVDTVYENRIGSPYAPKFS